jgi:hypothetical protein
MRQTEASLGGRIGQMGRLAENLAEHLLSFFAYRTHTLEVSELSQGVDSESMQQEDGGALAFVVVGDAESVEGRECVHGAP